MLEDLLNAASYFDLITPAMAFLEDYLNGPAAHFGASANAGWTLDSVKRVLARHGVKAWGFMLSPDATLLMFAVAKRQARWAYLVLQKEGVPLLYAPPEATRAAGRRSGKRNHGAGLLDPVFKLLDELDRRSR